MEVKKKKRSMSGKCYQCKHRGAVFYSAHSSCKHPKQHENNVKGDAYGSKSGWFNFPSDFDPVWLENCDGFEKKGD